MCSHDDTKALFAVQFAVRDYECDLQGIVNNAVYQNYLEHTRHLFLKATGADFAALSSQGIDFVVVRAELDYLKSLQSGDSFKVWVDACEKVSPLRLGLRQRIELDNGTTVLKAHFFLTSLNKNGRPGFPKQTLQTLLSFKDVYKGPIVVPA
jgi:acyl-CoA thioester hydrolase